jgi:hypothetical protein
VTAPTATDTQPLPGLDHSALAAAWLDHMRHGDFDAAWRVSEIILASRQGAPPDPSTPRHLQYVWTGAPLKDRRVLVRCYHGLGDTIQFVRYAPKLRAIAQRVIVWAQPSLMPLLRTADGIDELLPLHDGEPNVDYDVDVEVMELPFIFRTRVDAVPAAIPYLHAPASPPCTQQRPAIGLVWAAGDWAPERSMRFADVRPLLEVPAAWHILQVGPALDELPVGPWLRPDTATIEATAAVMRNLDLVITVDSMPAHLAGAIGVPVWTMIPVQGDWRWMRDRDESPWYPTMRLFRQRDADDWRSVIARVVRELTVQ